MSVENDVGFAFPGELRDWFAGQALGGPLASIFPAYIPGRKDGGDYSIEQVASVAYRIADAMIVARRPDEGRS